MCKRHKGPQTVINYEHTAIKKADFALIVSLSPSPSAIGPLSSVAPAMSISYTAWRCTLHIRAFWAQSDPEIWRCEEWPYSLLCWDHYHYLDDRIVQWRTIVNTKLWRTGLQGLSGLVAKSAESTNWILESLIEKGSSCIKLPSA